MDSSGPDSSRDTVFQTTVDVVIKMGILLLLLAWCFQIIYPFISIVMWAVIIAISFFPLFKSMNRKFGDRKKLTAAILTILSLSLIIIPSLIFAGSLVEGLKSFSNDINNKNFHILPPPEDILDWPLIGSTIYGIWQLASENLMEVVEKYESQLLSLGNWILNAFMGTGLSLIQFIISMIIAGIFLAKADLGSSMTLKLYKRLAGSRGEEFAGITEITIRNVTKGVLGVAVLQSFLAGIVFLLAGLPYAGLWALVCLILCVIQLGPGLVIIPVIVYIFSVAETWVAVIWTFLLIVVMLSDNIMKPLLMGKGAPVPMLVIFLGSIGGFIATGFIGLFIGAIVLSLGYKLFIAWIDG